jgi:hypothetical protein
MDIWAICAGATHIVPIAGTLMRMVESQEQVATTRLVDSLDKQQLLEEMLESIKPGLRKSDRKLHYLLSTPFRYPPLKHGSRFGRRGEPSLFYGSLTLQTMLAEAAYYRLVFWFGMNSPPPRKMNTQHSIFEVGFQTSQGVKLQDAPFAAYLGTLSHPSDYRDSQAVGRAMREAGVAAFEYVSARDPDCGVNVAVFSPEALAHDKPGYMENWLAETCGEYVRFSAGRSSRVFEFPLVQFAADGTLPQPAV